MNFNDLVEKNKAFWTEDRSLTALLVYVIVNTFVVLPFSNYRAGEFTYSIIYSLMLLSGVFAMGKTLRAKMAILLLAVFSSLVNWTLQFQSLTEVRVIDDVLGIIFFCVLISVMLRHIFREGDVTIHRIEGAVAVYLLIGLIFSKSYQVIFFFDPHAFIMPGIQGETGSFYSRFVYFSFVTLTTLGFGDITAVNLGAKSLVMVEGLVGQLFPAIMITRLVTLEIEYRKQRKG